MRARLTAAAAGLAALLASCAPTDDKLGIVQDAPNDSVLSVSVSNGWPERFLQQLILRPDGSFRAVIESGYTGDKSCTFAGKLDPSAWSSAITALDDARFWFAEPKSRSFHAIRPGEPNGAQRVYALPEGSPHFDQSTIEIDWRREDGKQKYIADAENPRTYEAMHGQLFAALKFSDLKCPDAPQIHPE
jgi:hypothetical protein